MAEGRSRLILLCVALAESLWLFALFSVAGLIIDLGGSPLPWLSMFLLMFVSILSGYVMAGVQGDEASLAIRQSLFGLVVIYVVLGSGNFVEGSHFDIGWIFRVVGSGKDGVAIAGAVFAFFICIWMWRHGLKLSTDRYPEDRLARVFKIGIAVLAIAVLVDEAQSENIGASALLVPFFGATLIGMAIGRLPESGVGRSSGQWARIIGVSVFSIIGTGMLIGLIGGLYGNGVVRVLFAGWSLLVDGFIWVLRFPVMWITAVVQWIISLLARDGQPAAESVQGGQSGQEIFGGDATTAAEATNNTVDTIMNIVQYPAIIIMVIIAFFILAMAFRRLGKRDSSDGDDERESLRDELETAGDMSRLLGGLIPGWMRRKQGRIWRYPDDPGLAEVFKLYFESITMGMKWGMAFTPQMTPAERLPLLQAALPGAPVREVTDRFNAACYGMVPTAGQRVAELRMELKAAETALRNR